MDLGRCAWETLKAFLKEAVPEEDAVPGAVIAIHTFGDFLGWHPHLHVLCTDGCFYGNGMFRVSPLFDVKQMEEIFRHKVFKILLKKEKITGELVELVSGWRHSGFNVFCGSRIQPGNEDAIENLARYIIRASFSQERMKYIPEESKVVYRSKDGKEEKVFGALEWLAAMCSHVPNKGQQMVRYFGFYSNVARGKRKKKDEDGLIPSILEPDGSTKEHKRNWARLIQKIYEVDPLTCAKCQGKMRIIAFIERPDVIKKILQHLGLWDRKARPPPKNVDPKIRIDTSDSQLPDREDYLYRDPEYPIEAYAS